MHFDNAVDLNEGDFMIMSVRSQGRTLSRAGRAQMRAVDAAYVIKVEGIKEDVMIIAKLQKDPPIQLMDRPSGTAVENLAGSHPSPKVKSEG